MGGSYTDIGWSRYVQCPMENAQMRMKPQTENTEPRDRERGQLSLQMFFCRSIGKSSPPAFSGAATQAQLRAYLSLFVG